MDVFNNSTRGHRNKSIIQLQESHIMLKSNLMINNQQLDILKNSINKLESASIQLEENITSTSGRVENYNTQLIERISALERYHTTRKPQ